MRNFALSAFFVVTMACANEPSSPAPAGQGTGSPTAAPPSSPAAPTPPPAAPAAPAAAVDDATAAKEIFATRCTPCHGPNGAGDGPAAAALQPKPASFSSPEWQSKVTDEHIEKIIVQGGAAVGKSPLMPPNPDLVGKDGVVKALRALVRGFKK